MTDPMDMPDEIYLGEFRKFLIETQMEPIDSAVAKKHPADGLTKYHSDTRYQALLKENEEMAAVLDKLTEFDLKDEDHGYGGQSHWCASPDLTQVLDVARSILERRGK